MTSEPVAARDGAADGTAVRRAALSVGSNLEDRAGHLRGAVELLALAPGVAVVAVSSVFETAPVGGPDQGPFLNAVVVVATDLSARELLTLAQAIEAAHGRERTERWGPRTLDVDVLAVGSEVSIDPVVVLPHPRAHERGFVLAPWAEVDPDFVVPGRGRVLDLLEALPPEDLTGVRPLGPLRARVQR